MEKEKTIFEVLFEEQICFAVSISIRVFRGKGIDANARDYFLIVLKPDYEILKKIGGFKRSQEYPNVYERDLSVAETIEFKTYMDKFVKVVHNSHGRVYELKDNSFKEMHKSINEAFLSSI